METIAVLLHNSFQPPSRKRARYAAADADEDGDDDVEIVRVPHESAILGAVQHESASAAAVQGGTLIVTPPAIRRQWQQEVRL